MNFHTTRERVLYQRNRKLVCVIAGLLMAVAFLQVLHLRTVASIELRSEEQRTTIKNVVEEQKEVITETTKKINEMNMKMTEVKTKINEIKEANPFLLNSNQQMDVMGWFTITAYDLSVQSCGKPMGHPLYGITSSGYDLSGHTWYSARTIAVDPRVIPMGSRVMVHFEDESYQVYNGVYTARDTGSAIKGRKIDFFMGDFQQHAAHPSTVEFGVRKVKIAIINET